MRICLLLAALVGALTVLPGCGACPNSAWSNCCQSWDFYDECDLIEGRRARCCQQSCYTPCDPGVVSTRDDCAGPLIQPDPEPDVIIEEEIMEGSPAVGDVVESTEVPVPPAPAAFPPPTMPRK